MSLFDGILIVLSHGGGRRLIIPWRLNAMPRFHCLGEIVAELSVALDL